MKFPKTETLNTGGAGQGRRQSRRCVLKAVTTGISISAGGLASNVLLPSVASAANNPPRSGTVAKFKTLRSYPKAPDVAFQDRYGNDRFTKEFKGRPLLITFWSVNCHACVYEMPTLEKVYRRATSAGYKILPVTIDQSDPVRKARRYYKRKGFNDLPVYTDASRLMFAFYNGYATPTTFIVDRRGHVAGGLVGQAGWDTPEAWRLLSYYA